MANKRRGEPPIPPNHEALMTQEQLDALAKLETFGWHLHLIRRPKFEPVEVVLEHSDGHFSVLLETGELDSDAPPSMRTEQEQAIATESEQRDGDPWANATDDQEFEVKQAPPDIEPTTVNNEPVPTQSGNNKRPPKILV